MFKIKVCQNKPFGFPDVKAAAQLIAVQEACATEQALDRDTSGRGRQIFRVVGKGTQYTNEPIDYIPLVIAERPAHFHRGLLAIHTQWVAQLAQSRQHGKAQIPSSQHILNNSHRLLTTVSALKRLKELLPCDRMMLWKCVATERASDKISRTSACEKIESLITSCNL
uniref:Uncharacterized protein n=1 Tax=Plectus sambesii TaxID=2011161 RepID=A0A914VEK3_9BILA